MRTVNLKRSDAMRCSPAFFGQSFIRLSNTLHGTSVRCLRQIDERKNREVDYGKTIEDQTPLVDGKNQPEIDVRSLSRGQTQQGQGGCRQG